MNEGEALEGLKSFRPSIRMAAASWFMENNSPKFEVLLRVAANKESVPQIRALLASAANMASGATSEGSSELTSTAYLESPDSILQNLATMVRHELEPAIGWVRLAAFGDIEDFESSDTNQAIEAMRERVSGLIAIILEKRPLYLESIDLEEMLQSCASNILINGTYEIDGGAITDAQVIETDRGLLRIILANALQNCADSGEPEIGKVLIKIDHRINAESFWITIRNRFEGEAFDFSEMWAAGRTTKSGHPGTGVAMMQAAAKRLRYAINLQGSGGVATFSLRGSR